MLIVPVILEAVVILAAVALAFALRSAGPAGLLQSHRRGRRDRDSRPAAWADSAKDPLIIVRERYARGENGQVSRSWW